MIGYRIFGVLGWTLIIIAVGGDLLRLALAHTGIFLLTTGYFWYKTSQQLNEKQ